MKTKFAGVAAATLMTGLTIAAASCDKGKSDKAALPDKPADTAAATPAAPAAPVESAAPATASAPPVESAMAPAVEAPATQQNVATRLTGQVTAQRASKIGFEVVGFINTAIAKPGSIVKKGDLLATLQDEDFDIRVQLARARRDQAKIQAQTSGKDFEREQQLKKENASTSSVLEKTQAGYDSARLALKLAELDLTQAERAFNDTKLRAPYDCVVAAQVKFDGENVAAGNPVYEIVDMSEPEITFEAPERLFGQIKVGDEIAVTVPSSGFKGKAKVVRMVPVITEKTRTFRIITKPDGGDSKIVPGTFAEALLN